MVFFRVGLLALTVLCAEPLAAGVLMAGSLALARPTLSVLTGAAVDSSELPPGFREQSFPEFRWASVEGRFPPGPALQRSIESDLAALRARLGLAAGRRPLFLYLSDRPSFERLVAEQVGERPEEWTLAVALPARALVLLDGERLDSAIGYRLDETLRHEIVHVLLGEVRGDIPRWYHEGLAQWFAGQRARPEQVDHVGALATFDRLLSFSDLDRFLPVTHRENSTLYTQSLLFVEFLSTRHGEGVHAEILQGLREGGRGFEPAFLAATRTSLADAESDWLERMRARFSWVGWIARTIGWWGFIACAVVVGFLLQRRWRNRRLSQLAAEEAVLGPAPVSPAPDPPAPDTTAERQR